MIWAGTSKNREVQGASGITAPRVLVTEDVPSYGVLAAVRGLRASGYDPWVAVTGKPSYAARSRACGGVVSVTNPALDPEGYATSLARQAEAVSTTAVLPGTERAIVALAGRTDRFAPTIVVGVCEPQVIRRAMDKSELVQLGLEARLRSPPTVEVHRDASVDLADITFPAIVKTPRKVAPANDGHLRTFAVERVRGPAELRRLIESSTAQRFLVQPYISSALEAICGVAWRGQVVCASHQVADRIFPPDTGVSACAHTVRPDTDLEQRVRKLVELIDWSGVFEVQVLRSGRRHYLIDFNPHMYGSLSLAIAAGFNLPAIWLDRMLGGTQRCGSYRVGVRYRCEERDAGSLFVAATRADWRTLVAGVPPRRHTVHAVFSMRDPLPAITSLRHLSRLRFLISHSLAHSR